MPKITISKNKLELYEKELTKEKFIQAFSGISNEQQTILNKIIQFLKVYVAEKKYPQKAIDAQNKVFSTRQANDIIAIFNSAISEISDKTIDAYIAAAVDSESIKDMAFSKADLNDLKKSIATTLKQAFPEKKTKKTSDKNAKDKAEEKDTSANDVPKLEIFKNTIEARVAKQLYIPKLNIGKVNDFLNVNVFKNLLDGLESGKFIFTRQSFQNQTASSQTSIKRKMRIWNPTIESIARPFNAFDRAISFGIRRKIKDIVKKFNVRLFNFLDDLFPLRVFTSIIKFGMNFVKGTIAIASKTFRFMYRTAHRIVSGALSLVRFTATTIYKIGSATGKFLYGSIRLVTRLKATKLLFSGALAFFKTYPGAFLLGYIVGRIWGKFKNILEWIKNAYDKVVEILTSAKNWFEENIYDPYIDPIIDKIVNAYNSIEGFADFYYSLFDAILKDPKEDISKNINDALEAIKLRNDDGSSMLSIDRLSRDISSYIASANNLIDNLSIDNLKTFAIRGGGRMLGGILGAKLGAAAGFALLPFPPLVGPIIGSLLGGFAGEALGGYFADMITATSKKTSVKKEETPLQEYIRESFGYENEYAQSTYSHPSAAKNIRLLKSLGKKSQSEFNLGDTQEARELKAKFGISVWGGNKEEQEAQREQLSMFEHIDNLSYARIFNEIKSSLDEMHTLMDSVKTDGNDVKGFLKFSKIDPSAWKTSIHLGNDPYDIREQFGDSGLGGGVLYNPYWLKVIRNIAILNALRRLAANQITPFDFLKVFEKTNAKAFSTTYLGSDAKIPLKIGESIYKISPYDLITGQYFKDTETELGKAALNTLPKNIRSQAMLNSFVAFFPTDNGLHILSPRLMQDIGFDDVLRSTGRQYFSGTLDAAPETRTDYTKFSDVYSSVKTEMFGNNPNVERFSKDDVANAIFKRLGPDAVSKWSGLGDDARRALVEETLTALAEGKTLEHIEDSSQYSKEKLYAGILDKAMRNLQNMPSAQFSSDLKGALENAFNDIKTASGEQAITLMQYSNLVKGNNEFLKNELIPALEILISQGADRNELYAIFGINSVQSGNSSPFDSTLVPAASPTTGL